jgi:hypothetical protein
MSIDPVEVVDDFLGLEEFDLLQHRINTTHWSDTCQTLWSKELWDEDCKVDITPVDPIDSIVDKFEEPFDRFANMLFNKYYPGSYIKWHVDKGYKSMYNKGFTLYMNNDWDRDWGGQLLYGDNKFIAPKPNRCVIIDRTVPHAVARTHETAPFRVTVQGWILNGTRDQFDFD